MIATLLLNCLQLYSQQWLPIHVFPSATDSLLAKEDSLAYFTVFANRSNVKSSVNNVSAHSMEASVGRHIGAGASVYGGQVSYGVNYRSVIDTPYAEKNILQHNINGQLNFSAFHLPLTAMVLIRRSNSDFFRNIQDVQLSLNPAMWRMHIQQQVKQRIAQMRGALEDSATAQMLGVKSNDLLFTDKWLHGGFQLQRLVEANEIISVPRITRRADQTDEKNDARENELKNRARKFIDLYQKVDSLSRALHGEVDSLQGVYARSKKKLDDFDRLTNGDASTFSEYQRRNVALANDSLPQLEMPAKYERLMGIRNLSIGRSPLQYSELTAKNVSINGINVEYNTWYYAALSAGLVDFRFRDFAIGQNTRKQYLVMARVGVGQLERDHFIVSAFRGFKQLYASGNNLIGTTGIEVTGFSTEAKWRINPNTDLTGEVGQSISPNFSSTSSTSKTRFDFSDKTNKAYAVKLASYYPRSGTRLEAMYKSTGANYQSFSSFQTNATMNTWYVKADQYLFKRIIRLAASVRTNDFANPYIVQQYSSNTVFKSASASFRKRGWPMLSIGYTPVTQLIAVDKQVMENRFQSLNVNSYHLYQVARTKTATTVMFNKFYNSSSDTSFVYYNASSVYVAQNVFLGSMIASVAVSDTRNSEFMLQVFDESLQFNIGHATTMSAGIKINNFNSELVKLGGYSSASIRLSSGDIIYLSCERGFIPAAGNRAVKSDMATVQFTKVFSFSKKYSTDIL